MSRSAVRYVIQIVSAAEMADSALTRWATLAHGTSVATRAISTYNGVPGGWGTPRILATAMNSPESQNGTVGVSVSR